MFPEGFSVPKDEIYELSKALGVHADALHGLRPREVDPSMFGGSDVGQELGHHSSLATQAVVQTVDNLGTGVAGHAEAFVLLDQDVDNRDVEANAALTVLERSVDCVTSPTMAPPNACQPPAGGAG